MTKSELEARLFPLMKGKRKVLICTHENPDPDSIASAYALAYIIRKVMDIPSVIAYGGIIGRAENRAMVKILGIELVPLVTIVPRNFSLVALVDCQPNTGNVYLPRGIVPSIIIDHHPLKKSSLKTRYLDVADDVGSTSTIVTRYLKALGLEVDRKVATALFYGIKSDTRDLGRESTGEDFRASTFLFPFILQKKLSRIEHPDLPRKYFQELDSVLKSAMIYGDAVLARVENIAWPEMIGEYADELIQLEGIKWCMCYGKHDGSLLFSIRTKGTNLLAGVLATKICRGLGKGGGHETFAAGKVEIAQALKKVKDPEDIIVKRFLKEVVTKGIEPVPLIAKF
jgi:nanoRNase/pAp phosphatase (c-di-AMP/oligoRNAs hydrolase)